MIHTSEKTLPETLQIGRRIAEVVHVVGLNQKGFADRLGVSQAFVSNIINDQAIPGGEFLVALNKEFGVSIDWVLNATGNMFGNSQIDIPRFKEVRLLVAVARAAVLDNNPAATAVVLLVNSRSLQLTAKDATLKAFLDGLQCQDCDIDLVTDIYNRYQATHSPSLPRDFVMADAIRHFQLLKPVKWPDEPTPSASGTVNVTITGANVRSAAHNYYENHSKDTDQDEGAGGS